MNCRTGSRTSPLAFLGSLELRVAICSWSTIGAAAGHVVPSKAQDTAGLEVTRSFRSQPSQPLIPDALIDSKKPGLFHFKMSMLAGRMAGSPPVSLTSFAVLGMSLQFSHIFLLPSSSFRTENKQRI